MFSYLDTQPERFNYWPSATSNNLLRFTLTMRLERMWDSDDKERTLMTKWTGEGPGPVEIHTIQYRELDSSGAKRCQREQIKNWIKWTSGSQTVGLRLVASGPSGYYPRTTEFETQDGDTICFNKILEAILMVTLKFEGQWTMDSKMVHPLLYSVSYNCINEKLHEWCARVRHLIKYLKNSLNNFQKRKILESF